MDELDDLLLDPQADDNLAEENIVNDSRDNTTDHQDDMDAAFWVMAVTGLVLAMICPVSLVFKNAPKAGSRHVTYVIFRFLSIAGFGLLITALFSSPKTELKKARNAIFFALPLYTATLLLLSFIASAPKTAKDSEDTNPDENTNDSNTTVRCEARNVFQDLTSPHFQVIVKGVAQLILFAIYVWGLASKAKAGPLDLSDTNVVLYSVFGVLLSTMYVTTNDNIPIPLEELIMYLCNLPRIRRSGWDDAIPTFWKTVVDANRENHARAKWKVRHENKNDACCHVSELFIRVRFVLDILVNQICVVYIIWGLPIQVACSEDPLEFVLNVVASFYIVELDDIDAKELELVTSAVENVAVLDLARHFTELPVEQLKEVLHHAKQEGESCSTELRNDAKEMARRLSRLKHDPWTIDQVISIRPTIQDVARDATANDDTPSLNKQALVIAEFLTFRSMSPSALVKTLHSFRALATSEHAIPANLMNSATNEANETVFAKAFAMTLYLDVQPREAIKNAVAYFQSLSLEIAAEKRKKVHILKQEFVNARTLIEPARKPPQSRNGELANENGAAGDNALTVPYGNGDQIDNNDAESSRQNDSVRRRRKGQKKKKRLRSH